MFRCDGRVILITMELALTPFILHVTLFLPYLSSLILKRPLHLIDRYFNTMDFSFFLMVFVFLSTFYLYHSSYPMLLISTNEKKSPFEHCSLISWSRIWRSRRSLLSFRFWANQPIQSKWAHSMRSLHTSSHTTTTLTAAPLQPKWRCRCISSYRTMMVVSLCCKIFMFLSDWYRFDSVVLVKPLPWLHRNHAIHSFIRSNVYRWSTRCRYCFGFCAKVRVCNKNKTLISFLLSLWHFVCMHCTPCNAIVLV